MEKITRLGQIIAGTMAAALVGIVTGDYITIRTGIMTFFATWPLWLILFYKKEEKEQ